MPQPVGNVKRFKREMDVSPEEALANGAALEASILAGLARSDDFFRCLMAGAAPQDGDIKVAPGTDGGAPFRLALRNKSATTADPARESCDPLLDVPPVQRG